MADWSQPSLTTPYATFLTDIEARNIDCITQMQGSTGTNLPDGSMRWNPSTYRWETYSASAGTWSAWTAQLSVGAINLGADPASALQAATKQYVDAVRTALSGYQPIGSYAALGGNASQVFLVANAGSGTAQAVPRSQADALYAPAGSYAGASGTASNGFTINSSNNTTESDLYLNCGGVNLCRFYNNAPTWGLYCPDGGDLIKYTRSSGQYVIANGVITATTSGVAMSAALTITTSGSTATLGIADGGANGANIKLTGAGGSKYIRCDSTNNFQILSNAYAGPLFQCNDAGAVTCSQSLSAPTVTQTSDGRLKTDIQPITNALDRVQRLHGVFYRWKSNPDGDRSTGLIAQDVEVAIPEAVGQSDDHLTVAYGSLVGLLVEAIKELRAEVAELRAAR